MKRVEIRRLGHGHLAKKSRVEISQIESTKKWRIVSRRLPISAVRDKKSINQRARTDATRRASTLLPHGGNTLPRVHLVVFMELLLCISAMGQVYSRYNAQ